LRDLVRGQLRVSQGEPELVRNTLSWAMVQFKSVTMKSADPFSTGNRSGLEQIAKTAVKHDFPVYIANEPIFIDLARKEEIKEVFVRVDSALTDISNQHDQVHYIDMLECFPMEDLANSPNHLLHHPVDSFTRRLTQAIRVIRNNNDSRTR
jgi:hypothetical protein